MAVCGFFFSFFLVNGFIVTRVVSVNRSDADEECPQECFSKTVTVWREDIHSSNYIWHDTNYRHNSERELGISTVYCTSKYEDINDTSDYQCHRELCKLNSIGKEVYEVMLMCWAEK